jgi:glycosyltransferase involved in cell wall biosynthesis
MLALSPVPEEGAGCRFRIAQYVPYLEAAGIQVTVSPFFTPDFFRLVYQNGRWLRKASLFAQRALHRLRTLADRDDYDIVFIYREAFPIGPALIETALARRPGTALVYDFDDAIHLPNMTESTSDANRAISVLKWPQKVRTIVGHSDAVIAGNEYLASYARQYNPAVTVIPTCVDTSKFEPRAAPRDPDTPLIVGWIGSPTTVPYLLAMRAILRDVSRTHPFVLRVCGAGSALDFPGVAVEHVPWTLESEVSLFNTCDVGIYPLSDDDWARGKCGFKAIQFMACGVPVVAAAVGVNLEIIQDGVNGFVAATPAEWIDKLTRLLVDPALRAKIGPAGRRRIGTDYSLQVNAPKFVRAVLASRVRARQRVTQAPDTVAADAAADPGAVDRLRYPDR